MKRSVVLTMAMIFALSLTTIACKSWAPNKAEEGKCSADRQWVPPKQDEKSGEWKEGYCEWMPGKAG